VTPWEFRKPSGTPVRSVPDTWRHPDALERLITDDDHRESLATQSGKKMATYNEECAAGHVDVWERVLDIHSQRSNLRYS